MSSTDSTNDLPFPLAATTPHFPRSLRRSSARVMALFEQFRNPLLRYAISFGIPVHDAEEIVQEVFLSLFRHLQLRGSRENLRGWIFRVAHNLALKQRYANQKSLDQTAVDVVAEERSDPSPNPEEQLSSRSKAAALAGGGSRSA